MSDFSQPLVAPRPNGALTPGNTTSPVTDFVLAVGAQYGSTTTAWTTANLAVYQAVIVQEVVTITHMAVFVVTAAGNIDVGIYTESGTKLVSSGSTAVAGTSAIQSFDVTDTTLNKGLYWIACACSSTSAVLRASPGLVSSTNGATAPARGVMAETSAVPLPTTATFAKPAATGIAVPVVAAMFRTTF